MSEDPASTPFVPVGDDRGASTVFSCPLCGGSFAHGALVCDSCPLHMGCDVVKCPNCGYQFPRSSKLVTWAKRLVRRAAGSGS